MVGQVIVAVLGFEEFFLVVLDQSEIRAISVNQWGSQLGLSVLNKLSQLYCSLVWESTVLLSLCTPNR